MVGIRLIIIMAIVGGLIAYLADKMGSKIGKKRMSVFGLRPKHTSILLTVLGGTIIAVLTISVMAIASQSARTALFGMEKIQQELKLLNQEKADTTAALESIIDSIQETLAKGEQVALVGFGTFSVKARNARTAKVPGTDKTVDVPATTVAKFKVGKALKDAVAK